jgi:hypothetical protein
LVKFTKFAGSAATASRLFSVVSAGYEWCVVCSLRVEQSGSIAAYRRPAAEGSQVERLEPKSTMSCRIDRVVGSEDRVTLRVSGRIQAGNVDTLRELLGREKAGVAIDLEEVILVDRQAIRLLAFSENNGTELRNCPAYIREWIDRERARVRSERSDPNGGTTDDAEDF